MLLLWLVVCFLFALRAQEAQNQKMIHDCYFRSTWNISVNGSLVPGKRWDEQGRGKSEGSLLLRHRMRKQRGTGQTCCVRGAGSGAGQGTGAPWYRGRLGRAQRSRGSSAPAHLFCKWEREVLLLENCPVWACCERSATFPPAFQSLSTLWHWKQKKIHVLYNVLFLGVSEDVEKW